MCNALLQQPQLDTSQKFESIFHKIIHDGFASLIFLLLGLNFELWFFFNATARTTAFVEFGTPHPASVWRLWSTTTTLRSRSSSSRRTGSTSSQPRLTTRSSCGTTARASAWRRTPATRTKSIAFSLIFQSPEGSGSFRDLKTTWYIHI